MIAAVIVAAGSGERFGGEVPKQLRDLGGLPILRWSCLAFGRHPAVTRVVVVLPAGLAASPPDWIEPGVRIVAGGATRAESVAAGVEAAASGGEDGIILVHDGVRPFVGEDLISRVIEGARDGPVVPVVPVSDTIKTVDDEGRIVGSPARDRLRAAQTPQGFPAALLRRLHARSAADAGITDEGVLCEREGVAVAIVQGDERNLKVTTPSDLAYANWLVDTGVIEVPIQG